MRKRVCIHRLLGAVGLVCALALASATDTASAQSRRPGVSPKLLQQIQAFREEKLSRTPAQRKIRSKLLFELKRRRADPSLRGIPMPRSRIVVAPNGMTLVDIKANVTDELLGRIEELGGTVVNSHPRYGAIRARVPIDELEILAALEDVISIRPADKAMTNKIDTSEGDVAHKADQARTNQSVDGSGVKVCALSDGVDSLNARQATGDLPPGIDVLSGQAGSGDEGTAILEIVHDLAPGAALGFATAFNGMASFAANIQALLAAGCDVIVDDVIYFAEAAFQDDIVAQAVDTVAQGGAAYFSSAGNSGNLNDGTSGVWEGDYDPLFDVATDATWHDWGSGVRNNITADPPFLITLQWSDPQDGSANDYDLYLVDTNDFILDSSTDFQTGTQDPIEGIDSQGYYDAGNRLVVQLFSGSPRFLRLNTHRGRLAQSTSGQTWGHNSASGAFGAAAVDARQTGGAPFDGDEPVERYSSDGPRKMFFNANGTEITPGNLLSSGGTARNKPDFTGADCVSTATPGFATFCGTSAAAPHLAAIAALLLQADPSLTPAQIGQIMAATTIDIEAAGYDRDSGYGIVDALAAVIAAGRPDLTVFVPKLVASSMVKGVVEVVNQGRSAAGTSTLALYISNDATLDGGDTLLANIPIGTLQPSPGAIQTASVQREKVRQQPVGDITGKYLLLVADNAGTVDESDENNVVAIGPMPVIFKASP